MNSNDLIIVIVDKNKEQAVINQTSRLGINLGVTIVGRGTGDKEKLKVLGITLEKEKRIVLLIVKQANTKMIVDELNRKIAFEGINAGILFVVPIKSTRGWGSLL